MVEVADLQINSYNTTCLQAKDQLQIFSKVQLPKSSLFLVSDQQCISAEYSPTSHHESQKVIALPELPFLLVGLFDDE